MTITIPEWLLWVVGIGGGIVVLYFAVIGILFWKAFKPR